MLFSSLYLKFPLIQNAISIYTIYSILASMLVIYHFRRRKLYKCASKLMGPPHWPIIGAASIFDAGSVALVAQVHGYHFHFRKLGCRIVKAFLGDELVLFCLDSTSISFALSKVLRKSVFYRCTSNLFRNGVLGFSKIEKWKSDRKLMAPLFKRSILKSYLEIFFDESNILVEKVKPFADKQESFYPGEQLNLATFDMIFRSTLGVDPRAQFSNGHPVVHAMMDILHCVHRRMFHPLLRYDVISKLIGYTKEEQKYERILRDYSRSILHDDSNDKAHISFAHHMRKNNINEEDLITQIINVIFAGTDTTKTANFASLLMLALHQDVQNGAYEEVISIMSSDVTIQPTYEDLNKMIYLEMIIKESLRLFPPVPIVGRQVITDYEQFGDLEVPKGVNFAIDVYTIHRDPTYYENPNEFNPDRFSVEEVSKRPIGSYIPFLIGPRDCLGRKYAMLQMKMIVSTVLRHYRIVPSENCASMNDVHLEMITTSKFADNCHIRLLHRTQ